MRETPKKLRTSKALLVAGLVLGITGGVILAERNRRIRLATRQTYATIRNLMPFEVVGYSDL